MSHLAIGFGAVLALEPLTLLGMTFSLPMNLVYCLIGAVIGTLIGVLPGLGPVATIAMLLPATYALPPLGGLIMLAGIYYGAQYGGSTTAILVNLPGETSSVVTCIDGYQMARRGRAGVALATAALGSFFAGCVGTLLLAAFAVPLAEVAFKFGPAEYFSLMVLGLIGAVVLASGSLIKAIAHDRASGLLGGLVGTDVNSRRVALRLRHSRTGRRHRLRRGGHGRVRLCRGDHQPRAEGAPRGVHQQGHQHVPDARTTSSAWSRRSCAAPCSVRCWASCRAAARRWPRSAPIRWKRRSARTAPNSARARSKASPRRSRPTTPRRRPRSSRC